MSAVRFEDFEHIKYVGEGAFGLVSVATKLNGNDANQTYALKMLQKKKLASNQNNLKNLYGEIKALKQVNGQYAPKLAYTFQNEHVVCLVMDYVEGCDLYTYMQKVGKLTMKLTKFFSAQLILALDYLNEEYICLRDLKPENIMVAPDGYLKLIDFGFAKRDVKNYLQKMHSFVGTTLYMAPECFNREVGYSRLVDWWALGAIIYEMYFGMVPFDDEDNDELIRKICEEEPYYPPKVNQNIEAIMVCLLMKDVHNRLGSTGLQEFKEYEFYAKFDFDALREKKLKAPFSKPFPKFEGLKEEEIVGWNFEGKKGIKDFKNFDYTAPELIKEKKKGRKRAIEEEEKENLPAKRVRKPKNLSLEGF